MDFKVVEKKWQKKWATDAKALAAEDFSKKPKFYVLNEFPYPSGSGLHVGHAFSFTAGDIYARFKRMQGYNVLFPMGYDAFGLPTENFAIKTKQKPQEVTKKNTSNFREEMDQLALSFDWSREVNTTDPAYYKWTQWIFIKLFEKGLAYKQEMPINWCPSCKIGLANEEVVNGNCERCGTEVSRRNISQWVVKITDYADRLIDGLKDTNFIERVKQVQINWIGKSEGAIIKFKINDKRATTKELEVFTTRPDTIYGATFMVISPEHKLVGELFNNQETKNNFSPKGTSDGAQTISKDQIQNIKQYVEETRKKSEMERTDLSKEKTGVFSGLYAINPITKKEIPIWISDFVLSTYGTGAIMSVPAHDERDKAFAEKFGLEIIKVVNEEGKMENSGELDGLSIEEAKKKVMEMGVGEKTNNYHLRDWIFSRQHYWGEPIPMIFCENCAKDQNNQETISNNQTSTNSQDPTTKRNAGWFTVPEEQLPIVLPEVEAYEPTDDGQSPLSKIESFVKCTCPKCGGEAKRETDTMPNWAGSDWYFLRYMDPFNKEKLVDFDLLKYWGPVDVYIGGDEHNTLHLLYSRFIYLFLYDLGIFPKDLPEPYDMRVSHGVILGPDNQRMSKSKGNVIVPGVVAEKYGVDVVRMYLMFMGPFDGTMAWNEKSLMGVKRFLDRFEKAVLSYQLRVTSDSSDEVKVIINKMVDGVTKDIKEFGYNTAIAKMMEALNKLTISKSTISKEDLKKLIKLMAPFAPYVAEELWSGFNDGSVHTSEWPVVEEKYLIEKEITIAVAVNGKVRSEILIENELINDSQKVLSIAKENIKVKPWIDGKELIKEIYVPGKMVNIVIK